MPRSPRGPSSLVYPSPRLFEGDESVRGEQELPEVLLYREVVHPLDDVLVGVLLRAEGADERLRLVAYLDGRGHSMAAIVAIVFKVCVSRSAQVPSSASANSRSRRRAPGGAGRTPRRAS